MIADNEEALRKFHPELLAALCNLRPADNVELADTRGKFKTLIWRDPAGKPRYLHSPVDPIAESQKLAKVLLGPKSKRALLIGHGLGYEIRAIAKDCDELWVLSANLPLLGFVCGHLDLSDLFANPRIRWLFGSPAAIQRQLAGLLGERGSQIGAEDLKVIIHPPLIVTLPREFTELVEVLRNLQSGRETEDVLKPLAEENFRKNFPALAAPGVAALFGLAKTRPVIVLGAGPTLDESLETIRKFHPNSYLIAVDTVLRGLSEEHLRPDVVISIDPRAESKMHFRNVDVQDTILVFTPITHPDIVRKFEGRRVVAIPKNHFFLKPLETTAVAKKGILMGGASVSIMAASLAAAMEPAFVCLAGIDFRRSQGRLYSRLASYHRQSMAEYGRFFNPEMMEHEFQSREIHVSDAGVDIPRLKHYAADFRHVVKQSPVPFYSFGPAPVEGVRSGVWPCVKSEKAPRPIRIPPEGAAPTSAREIFERLGISP